MQTPNFRATTQSAKEELFLKIWPLFFENSQHYENVMIFFKNIPNFDVESKHSYQRLHYIQL